MGAYGLTVAAAFAVALAVLLSVSTTQTAEAATVTLTTNRADVEPGDTVIIPGQAGAEIVNYAIVGGTATGSFAVGGEQTLSCSDSTTGRGCDTNTAPDTISVKLNVDADSPDGYIQVTRTQVLPVASAAPETVVITVTTQPRPVSVTLTRSTPTIDASADASDTSVITATIKFDKTPNAAANSDETLTFITTLGSFTTCGENTGQNTQVCADVDAELVDTNDDETMDAARATVTLSGANREGTAVITTTHASVDPATTEVTLFGDAKNLTAEAEQGSVEIGGNVFVVLTVTDSAGNPVSGAQPVPGDKEVVGPNDDATLVTTGKTDSFTEGGGVTSPYNVDHNVDNTASKSIPACGDDVRTPVDDGEGTLSQLFATASSGTNGKGQCVVQVKAPKKADGAAKDATRGVHTVNFALGAKLKAAVEVTVAGGPAAIESDAPEYVDPLSDTTITVTVLDDEGVLVGATDINVIMVAGDGLVEGAATDDDAKTKNGSSTFSYAAGLEGQVVFRVIAGTGTGAIRDIITLQIGEAMPDEPDMPAMPDGDATLTVQGNLGSFSGGSVEALHSAAEAACAGGAQIAAQDADGTWHLYGTTAIAIANSLFNAAFADGFDGMTLIWVTSCEADAMESEG